MPEAIHWGFIFGTTPLIMLAFYQGYFVMGWLYLLLNIPINVYPILLKRYTRAKLMRIAELRMSKSAGKGLGYAVDHASP